MATAKHVPNTITEAESRARIRFVLEGTATVGSNSRVIPYGEIYRDSTAVMETPVEHLLRAVEDQRKRDTLPQ